MSLRHVHAATHRSETQQSIQTAQSRYSEVRLQIILVTGSPRNQDNVGKKQNFIVPLDGVERDLSSPSVTRRSVSDSRQHQDESEVPPPEKSAVPQQNVWNRRRPSELLCINLPCQTFSFHAAWLGGRRPCSGAVTPQIYPIGTKPEHTAGPVQRLLLDL